MSKIVFYDLPSRDNQGSWSPNTLKTRLALNFKGLDYQTEWVEYPDIAATISPYVTQNELKQKSDSLYSLPTVKLPDGTYVMDSKKIAERLEHDYPTPSLKLNEPLLAEVQQTLPKIAEALRGVWMPQVPPNLLNEASKEYFARTRAQRFGKPLEQIARENGGEEAWIEALPAVKALGEILQKNDGPFVLGKEGSYADITILAFLYFLTLVDNTIYEKLVKIEPRLDTLYNAGKVWTERNSH